MKWTKPSVKKRITVMEDNDTTDSNVDNTEPANVPSSPDTSAGSASECGSYQVGWKKPPTHSRWTKGQSGNPTGSSRKNRSSLLRDAISEKLDQEIKVTERGRNNRVTRRQFLVRKLVEEAAKGSKPALLEIIRISEASEGETESDQPYWYLTRYSGALSARPPETFGGDFFEEQDKRVAEWRKELRTGGQSLQGILQRELRRRVSAKKGDQSVIAPIIDVIVARFFRKAQDGDVQTFRLLLMIVPPKKHKRDHTRVEILRPTAKELEHYPAPGTTWEEWEEKKEVAAGGTVPPDSEAS